MQRSWKANFYILWTTQLVAIIGFQAIQPFLPYYIQEFGVRDLSEAVVWAGHMGTAAGLAMAFSAPIWGLLADRFGRKSMVVRSMLGGGITVVMMAYVASLNQLLIARFFQGVLAGTVAACITLVSTTTPRQHLGYALGLMQGAVMLGTSLGPLVGAPFIERYGYESCFVVSGALVTLAGAGVQLWVREDFRRAAETGPPISVRAGFLADSARLLRSRAFLLMVVSLTLIQFAFGVTQPVVPLFLQDLAHTDNIVGLAGKVFSVAGLVGALSSAVMGRWSDRLGARQTLLAGLLCNTLFIVFQGMAGSVWVFAGLMVLAAVAGGAIRPVANAMIARIIPDEDRGKAFGLLTSANAFGWALGPAVGGYLAALLGFRMVFYVTAVLFLAVTLWVWRALGQVPLDEPAVGRVRAALWRWRAERGAEEH